MFVESSGARLSVNEVGTPGGSTVVLVHGFPDTSAVWDGVTRELGDRFRVVTFDLRGFGNSSAPRDRSAYVVARLAKDLEAVIDAVSPDRPVHLAGHDWGGIIGWEAVTEPELQPRIASFTAISGPCLDHTDHWTRQRLRPGRGLLQALRQAFKSWYIAAFQLPLLPELLWRFAVAPRWPYPQPTIRRDAITGLALYRANFPRFGQPRERRTEVPVQIVSPRADRFVSASLSEGVERWVPRLWRREIAGGHWVVRERPRLVARVIAEHVDQVEGIAAPPRQLRRARAAAPRDPFADRLAVVTGAGSGIGRATAQALQARGAEVVGCDLDGTAAAATVGTDHAHQLDVSDRAAMERFAETVCDRHGVPDLVVNNAGIGLAGAFLATSPADWERILDVNLWGVIHGSRLFGERMAERGEGGQIVNVASAAAYTPSRTLPAYSTTKAAVLMLSECLRAELAEHAIGVTAICPGVIATNITRATRWVGVDAAEQERRRESTSRLYAMRRFGPDRVARDILRAIERNRAVAPVTVEAKATYALSRLTPGVLRALARQAGPYGESTSGSSSSP